MSNTLQEIKELTRMRVLLFLREPEAVFWVIVVPLALAIILGWAFQKSDVEGSAIGVHSPQESTAQSLIEQLKSENNVEVEWLADRDDAEHRLSFGKIALLVLLEEPRAAGTIPGESVASAGAANPATMLPTILRYDPQRPEADAARLRVERALFVDRTERESVRIQLVAETGSRYIDWLFPGLLGMNLMGTGIWGIGFAIADIRQKKLLRRFLVTPMRRSSFMLSFIFSRGIFLVMEVSILVLFAIYVLGVPLRGSIIGFGALCLSGTLTFAAIGILIASRARTIEGVSGLMNVVMMPMWLFSGVFFSYDRFPDAVHPFIKLLPLTAINDGLRTLMLDGATLTELLPQIGIQLAWGIVTFLAALKLFRWE